MTNPFFGGEELNDLKKTPQTMVVVVPESKLVYEPAYPPPSAPPPAVRKDFVCARRHLCNC